MTWEELEGLAERLSSLLEPRVDEYVVIVDRVSERMLKLANGEASVTQGWRELRVTVYVARRDGRLLYTSLSAEDPTRPLEDLVSMLGSVEPSPLYAPLPEPSGESYSLVDPAIKGYLEGAADLDLAGDLELSILGDAAGMALLGWRARLLASSSGARLRGENTYFTGYMRVFRAGRSGQWSWVSASYSQGRPARRAIQVARGLAEECSGLPRERVEPGRYRLLLSPMVAGNLVEYLVEAASGGSVVMGNSFLGPDKVGEQVFSGALSVYDEPRNKALPGYSLFDEEGVATRDKPVIERGVLRNILHNTKTARVLGGETTGNAGLVFPEPFNIRVATGSLGPDDMLDALGEGIYVTNNWYTRYQNPVEGTFSTVSRDAVFLVKGGRPRACLERIRIADSLPGLFQRVEDLGREAWPVKWWEIRTPSLVPHVLVGEAGVSLPLV